MSIKTVKGRAALQPRREPYWESLGRGKAVGFRQCASEGSWIAKYVDVGGRLYRSLGDLTHITGCDRYTEARRLADEWFDQLALGGQPDVINVRQACARYVDKVKRKSGPAAAAIVAGRFKRHVNDDSLAAIPLMKLKPIHVEEWRDRLAALPVKQPKRGPKCRAKTSAPPPRLRSDASLNRDMTPIRAALNAALKDGYVLTDKAWREALKPKANADRRRETYLDRAQRQALIAALPKDLADFVHALAVLPLRPGALAALRVADLRQVGNGPSRVTELKVGTDKAGKNRVITLPASTAELLRQHVKNKLPNAPLLSRADGSHWTKDAWKKPIKAAVVATGLPSAASAYCLRHSVLSDLASSGCDLLTIAKMAGTSVKVIDDFYGHLNQEVAKRALEGLAL